MEKNNKNSVSSVITMVIIMILIILACFCIYLVAIKYLDDKYVENNSENEMNVEESISSDPLYTKENFPKIDASLATQPFTDAILKDFTGEEIEYEYSNTHPAYVKLINDEVDLIVVTEPSKEELEMAKQNGVELEVIPVVKEGFVFYVNANNKVDSLTTDQIQGIYSGEITNWKEVGGDDEAIVAYQRPTNSGSQTGMLSLVMKDKKLADPLKENLVQTMAQIINLVSNFDNGKNSIGYSYYYYATTMFETIDSTVASNIKLIGVNGVKPNNATIKNGLYPYNTAYYIVINKADDDNSASRKLASELLSARGQNVAKNAGYVPVK